MLVYLAHCDELLMHISPGLDEHTSPKLLPYIYPGVYGFVKRLFLPFFILFTLKLLVSFTFFSVEFLVFMLFIFPSTSWGAWGY
jgi:hypothetical protein